jgi:uncharacterized protein (TIGR02246 family)
MSLHVKPLIAATLALVLVAGCQTEPASETGATEETPAVDVAAVRQAIEADADAWESAALAGDAASLAALYAEDAIVQPPNAPRLTGRAGIETGFAEMFAATPFTAVTISTDAVEVSASGDLAYAYGTYTATVTLPDGTAIDDTGKWLSVHENRDGDWLFVADNWNSDLALPGMEESESP